MGGGLVALGLFLTLSLATYHINDPSFNRAAGSTVHNWGGVFGAYIADPLLQFIGLASVIPILALLAWGIKILCNRPIGFLWLRFALMLMSVSAAAALLSFLSVKEWWVLDVESIGGVIGKFTKDELSFYIGAKALLTLCVGIFILSLYGALGVTPREWWKATTLTARGMAYITVAALRLLRFIRSTYRRFSTDGQEEDEWGEVPVTSPKRRIEVEPAQKKKTVKPPAAKQSAFAFTPGKSYEFPEMDLLGKSNKKQKYNLTENSLSQNARLLESVLSDFGVMGSITKVRPGPVVTLYELEPAAGTKSSRVIGLADDIARSMSAVSARIAVIPGRNVIGIELPNASREMVYFRELLETDEYKDESVKLPIALGKNIGGEPVIVDLSRMPHLLVAGTTGSGKSVAINSMIISFLYRLRPDECKFIMIDPKMLELSVYDGIPHLLCPVVTEPGKAVVALKWAVKEMENRYRLMSNLGVRNVAGYNKKIQEALESGEVLKRTVQTGFEPETGKPIIEKVPLEMAPLPFIVVVVDEMADLMLVAGKDIEMSIQRLAQMARAAGIHIIMATQRPSVDVITGVIKANFPTRISFQVTSRIDSRTILGEQGAEQLLGMGDMLYMAGGGRITRLHGPFVDDKEVEKVVAFLKTQGEPQYIENITESDEEEAAFSMDAEGGEADLYRQAVAIVCRDRKASTSYVQRCLKIGYNRAANLIEQMEREGIISAPNHAGKREVLEGA